MKIRLIIILVSAIISSETNRSIYAQPGSFKASYFFIDSFAHAMRIDTLRKATCHAAIGPITLINCPEEGIALELSSGAGVFTYTLEIPIKSGFQATFDSSSPEIPVTLYNLSSVTFAACTLSAFNADRAVTELSPGDSQVVKFPVAGKSISGLIDAQIKSFTGVATNSQLGIRLNFNGLKASYVKANDHNVSFDTTIVVDYKIADSIAMDYVDLYNGFLAFEISNHAKSGIAVSGELLHLWSESVCAQRSFTKLADLSGFTRADTNNYFGRLTNGFVTIEADSTFGFLKQNLAGTRLFPIWGLHPGVSGGSYARMVLQVKNALPRGDTVTYSSLDSLSLVSMAPSLKFKDLFGTVTETYHWSDIIKVKVPAPWNTNGSPKAFATVATNFNLPDSNVLNPRRARIDTILASFTVFNPKTPAVLCKATGTFTNVSNSSAFNTSINISSIIVAKPDSIYIIKEMSVPSGTAMNAVNDLSVVDPDYPYYFGRCTIKGGGRFSIDSIGSAVLANPQKTIGNFYVAFYKGKLIFQTPASCKGISEVLIFSMAGKCIKQVFANNKENERFSVEVLLTPGVYFVGFKNRNTIYRKKIFIP